MTVGSKGRKCPPDLRRAEKRRIEDSPNISTSFAEPQNLTMRMHMRRFTRLTNPSQRSRTTSALALFTT
jgi:hypothetical protein